MQFENDLFILNGHMGHVLWNSLIVSVKSVGNLPTFRNKLKTHLFRHAYPP